MANLRCGKAGWLDTLEGQEVRGFLKDMEPHCLALSPPPNLQRLRVSISSSVKTTTVLFA